MRLDDGHLRLTATDVTKFAACPHATAIDVAVAHGQRARPPFYPDPSAALLAKRGLDHEAAYLAGLRASHAVEEIPVHKPEAAARTRDAMQRGVAIISQGTLRHDRWVGIPDFLRRVDVPSSLGPWSYEPIDAKLAREAKPGAVLQLCFYAELLLHVQGTLPQRMTLVLGDGREASFATARYAAYFRYIRACFAGALDAPPVTYPEPVDHCDVCDYARECDGRRRADDHLSLVAGITRSQRRALTTTGIATVRALADAPLDPAPPSLDIGTAAFERVREQARIQVEGRDAGALRYELLREAEPGRGLAMLPEPSPGDLFLDLEGDPYALRDGIEYLFGVVEPTQTHDAEADTYRGEWALDRRSERTAFEAVIALIVERRARHPGMHVYHYNHYEPTAFKRLAGRHGVCIDELDDLLRGAVFVDLYRAVRQGLRASVESYSIKRLEPLYGFAREVPLQDARRCLAAFEAWMELRPTEGPPAAVRDVIRGYNRDDCVSTLRLRDWLEERRLELVRDGVAIERPAPPPPTVSEDLKAEVARVRAVATALLDGLPEDPDARTPDETARYLLAHLLEWHRREAKSEYWEYFRLCDLTDDELQDDATAIGGLTYEAVVGREKQSLVHRYRFPAQDHAMDRALKAEDPRTRKTCTIVGFDDDASTVDIKRGVKSEASHPTALIPGLPLDNATQRKRLLALGEHVVANGLAPTAPFGPALALLQRTPPRGGATPIHRALAIDGSVLPIQGPPGAGKTHLAAEMIEALLAAGKRVGIVANSHKVITHLLDKACAQARRTGTSLRAVQRCDKPDYSKDPFVRQVDNAEVERAVRSGEANVVAGTSWLWCAETMVDAVDVLFVDEAGQMALANVLACAAAANGLVLLGDPQQLNQPLKGVHPQGADASALGHILGARATIDPDQGIFLEETWRMHPHVCDFVSEVFYDGRLGSKSELALQRVDAPAPLAGTGLRFLPVVHRGNRSESPEEVEVVAALVERLTSGGCTWTDRDGVVHALGLDDVLVVAPYNAHVARLKKRLPRARVGTVDKFQGQEAPIAIYSMATSSPDDAPRGMEFLYSANRFNVAISRARCATFLVANPRLFEVTCRSERQMALVNGFCRYLEVAEVVEP